jgi:hypothetical protein
MEAIYAKADRQREAEMEAMEAEVEQRPEHALARDDIPEDAPQHRQPAREAQQAPQHDPNQDLVWAELGAGPVQVTRAQDAYLRTLGMTAATALGDYQRQQAQQMPQHQSVADRQRIAETVRAIQYGDEATAGDALSDLINHVARRQPDPEAVINRRLAEIQQKQYLDQAQVQLRQEFQDIFADPIRTDAAARQVALLRNHAAQIGWQGDQMEIFRQAAVNVRASMGMGAPQQGRRQSSSDGNIVVRRSVDEIEGRKRVAPRAFSQVIDRRSPAPQQSRAPTGSEIVEHMRRQRGQA